LRWLPEKGLIMRTIYVDCLGARSVNDLWQRYIDAAKPDGADLFGRNLDAFWDAIERGGPGWPGNAKLVFTNTVDLESFTLPNGTTFLDSLRQIARDATRVKIEIA
jgi:hypothetical protein